MATGLNAFENPLPPPPPPPPNVCLYNHIWHTLLNNAARSGTYLRLLLANDADYLVR